VTTRTIAVVSAGLSNPSSTRLLADRLTAATVAALRARGEDATVEVVELRGHARALADHLTTGFAAPELQAAIDTVVGADAVIAVTPVFSASYSGLFKTFVDVLDKDALRGTPVLLAATAGTARHSLVVEYAMRPLFAYLQAVLVPTGVFAATEDWAGGDRGLADRIDRAAGELAGSIAGRPAVREPVDPFADPTTSFEELLGGR
jgi:FMN reductase